MTEHEHADVPNPADCILHYQERRKTKFDWFPLFLLNLLKE